MDDIKPGSFIYTNNPPVEIKGLMTLRDYFAAKALQGMLSTDQIQMVIGKTITQENVAGACYEWADAMLKAREK